MQLDPATVIFAFLALFVLWKLRSVLGERTGFERRRDLGPSLQPVAPPPAPVAEEVRWKDFAERGTAVWSGLDQIAAAQPEFEARAFLSGASEAYKTVVNAFSTGDEATLRSLTSEEV